MADTLKVLSMNVRGLSNRQKRQDVFHWLQSKKMSIYCLVDVHADEEHHQNFKHDWGSECIFSSYSSVSRGVAILFSESVEYSILEVEKDTIGNLLLVKLNISGAFTFLLGVLYGPNRDEPEFYNDLIVKLSEKENLPLIICGDFNLVQDFSLDTYGYIRENNIKAKAKVMEMQSVLDLEDVWRVNNENKRIYTWSSSKAPRQMARLDYFLTTSDIHSKLISTAITPGYRTDHSALTLEIQLHDIKRGKGFWKFNTSLLRDVEYKKSAKSKEKKLRKKQENEKLTAKQLLVDAANETDDPMAELQPFKKFERNGLSLVIKCARVTELDESTVEWAFQLTKSNMQALYESSEWGWNDEQKREEMKEESAWYLIAEDGEGKPVACVHFRFDIDCDDAVLYCYEIQLVKEARRKGLGKFMMQVLELIAHKTMMEKVMLTVFKHNEDAHNFFINKLKYTVDETSPEETMAEAMFEEETYYTYQILGKKIPPRKQIQKKTSEQSAPLTAVKS